jgi:hypothetical protein
MTLKLTNKLIYFASALMMYLLFRYGLGPRVGLEGIWLLVGAYLFALIFPTLYLYLLWTKTRKNRTAKEEP